MATLTENDKGICRSISALIGLTVEPTDIWMDEIRALHDSGLTLARLPMIPGTNFATPDRLAGVKVSTGEIVEVSAGTPIGDTGKMYGVTFSNEKMDDRNGVFSNIAAVIAYLSEI